MLKFERSMYPLLLAIGLTIAESHFNTAQDYSANRFTTSDSIRSPRSLIRDDSGDILVISKETGQVVSLYEDGEKSVKTALIIDGKSLGLNHGLAYNNGYLYASSSSQVLRWGYEPGQRATIKVTPEVVVKDIPADKGYLTRSLIVDRNNYLYVSVGAAENVVESETRAQIRRFSLVEGFPVGGFEYANGEVFAKGLRNAVGLAIDRDNHLWGVDCGADDLYREDLGGDIHNTNPADELIRLVSGTHYGYPYCWTVDELWKYSRGQQFAWPDFINDKTHTDAWCQNAENNHPPTLPLPAHNAPLGLVFYDGVGCGSQHGSFPCSMKGDLFIAFHGSKNREPASGYKVVRIPINPDTRLPTEQMEDVIYEANTANCILSPTECFRPVDLVFSQNGQLILSSDSSNEVIRVSYQKSSEEESEVVIIVKKVLHLPGILAIVLIAFITLGLLSMIIYRYCCRRSEHVPYMRENI